MKKIIPIILVVAVILGFKAYNKSKAGSEIKERTLSVLQSQLGSLYDAEYIEDLVDYAHPTAMDSAYNMGGRRKSAEFDVATYNRILGNEIQKKLQKDGKAVGGNSMGGFRSY